MATDQYSNTAPEGGFVTLKPCSLVLAATSEFVTAADGSPIALKIYQGAAWYGWDGYEIISASKTRTFTMGDMLDSAGGLRAVQAKNPGFEIQFTIQHDRSMPVLEELDWVQVWVRDGAEGADNEQVPALKRCFVVAVSNDDGAETTAQYKVTLRYIEGFCDATSNVAIRAKIDQLGRVVNWKEGNKIEVDASHPGMLPGGIARAVTGESATNVITMTGTALANGTRLVLLSKTGASGLTVNNVYYVRDASGATFKLANMAGGSAVALGTDLAGTMAVAPEA